ncbi:MAG: GAF domain-containing protein [Candidatus Omnitrophica bacterium]|nr:GAF domain-containing protein [Candidatus Omnitrophota bacterium]
MNLFAIAGLSCGISCAVLAFVALIFGKLKVQRLLAYFNIAVAVWGFGCFFVGIASNQADAIFGWKFAHIGGAVVAVLFFHMICEFCGVHHKALLIFGYIQAVAFNLISWGLDIAVTKTRYVYGLYYNVANFYVIFIIAVYVFLVSLSFFEVVKFFKKSKGIARVQSLYVMIGFAVGFIGGTSTFSPEFKIDLTYPFGNFGIVLYCLIVTYAILKHHVLDINVAVTRAGIFLVVNSLVLGIPFWIGYTTKSWFFATSLAAVLATFGPFVYGYLRRHAEQIILKEQHAYQQALRELSETMTHIRDLDKLIKTIATEVVELVKVKFVLIYVKDELHKSFRFKYGYPGKIQGNFLKSISLDSPLAKRLDSNKRPVFGEEAGVLENIGIETGMVVPLFAEDGLLGFMFLGPKQGDRVYTSDDVLVFETLSYSTSLAMENCRFWKEIEERQRFARVQEMNTFSYSLAHEIDNPMTIIIGQANLLKKFFLKEVVMPPEKQKEAEEELGYILEAAWRVSGMVDAIQDLGQRSSGEFSLLKINEVVDSFCKLYLPIFRSSSVYFTKDVPEDLPYVRGVKAELMQILVIFSNNAIHAMLARRDKEKKASLKVELRDSEWIRISMTDNGYGITPEKLEIIFAPFVTSKASTEGTGMGLYNAKKIIERHKGRIWAESDGDDLGATFIVEVPIAKDVSPAELKGKEFKGRVLFGFEDGGGNGK